MFLMLVRVAVLLLIAAGPGQAHADQSAAALRRGRLGRGHRAGQLGQHGRDRQRQAALRDRPAAADQIMGELRDGDQVVLLRHLRQALPRAGQAGPHPGPGRADAARRCKVSYERADVGGPGPGSPHAAGQVGPAQQEIFVISDFQANTWESFKKQETAGAALVKDDKAKTDETKQELEIPVIMVDCQPEPRGPTWRCTTCRSRRPCPWPACPSRPRPRCTTPRTMPQQRLAGAVHRRQQGGQQPGLNIPPIGRRRSGGTTRHEFTFTFQTGGMHRGEVRLVGEDGSKLDDRRYFTMDVDQGIPVAVVKPQQHEIAYLEDTFYLEQALGRGRSGGWAIRGLLAAGHQLPNEPLNNYKVIYLVDLPALDDETAEKLRTYVERGGNVFWSAAKRQARSLQPDEPKGPRPVAAAAAVGCPHRRGRHRARPGPSARWTRSIRR